MSLRSAIPFLTLAVIACSTPPCDPGVCSADGGGSGGGIESTGGGGGGGSGGGTTACSNECSGATATDCANSQSRSCELGADGCFRWSQPVDCAGTCVNNSCVVCDEKTVADCVATSCATEKAAAFQCSAPCGAFPTPSCIAQHCTSAYETLSRCVVNRCTACDGPQLCDVFCKRSIACHDTTTTLDECKRSCEYLGIDYPAACGSVIGCGDLRACQRVTPNRCGADQFACRSGTGCASIARRCDTTPDCADASDEGGICGVPVCTAGKRSCGGACTSCPTDPASTRSACQGSTCVVGECRGAFPAGSTCQPVTHSTIVSSAGADDLFAPIAARLDATGKPHVLYLRRTGTTFDQLAWATRSPAGAWTSLSVPLPVDKYADYWLVVTDSGDPSVMMIPYNASMGLQRAWHDASGWHTETFSTIADSVNGAGFDPTTGDIVAIVGKSIDVTTTPMNEVIRRTANGFTVTSFSGTWFPSTHATNLVFRGGGQVAFGANQRSQYCEVGATTGSCTSLASWTSADGALMFDPGTQAASMFLLDPNEWSTEPGTLFSRSGTTWTNKSLPDLDVPSIDQNRQPASWYRAVGSDGSRIVAGFYSSAVTDELHVASWTGTDWLLAHISAGTGRGFDVNEINRGFEVAARGARSLLVASTGDGAYGIEGAPALDAFEF